MRYRFVGASGEGAEKRLYWESVDTISPNESRVDEISVSAQWFWSPRRPTAARASG